MAERLPPEDPDYLAATQLTVSPASFKEQVREAYALEHGCKQYKEIAEIVGVDKSWITQLLKHPSQLDAKAVERLIEPLRSRVHKRNILGAWVAERFEIDLRKPEAGRLVRAPISEQTVTRVDRLIRQNRLVLAAMTAEQALRIAGDYSLRQELLDRAYWARQRLEQPGRAMIVARSVVVAARKEKNSLREAQGYFMRARIILGMSDCTPDECEPLIRAAQVLVAGASEPPNPHPPYLLATPAKVRELAFNALLIFTERGLVSAESAELQQMLSTVEASLKQTRIQAERFRLNITASRLCLLLGDTFRAQECVDRAFHSGGTNNLEAIEVCGLFQGRILKVIETPAKASEYLKRVSINCFNASDHYHQRRVEYELARLEAHRFPQVQT